MYPVTKTSHDSDLRDTLSNISQSSHSPLTKSVIVYALNQDSIKDFFSDLLAYGCQSGIVTDLVYYFDTHTFYDNHYQEIEDLRIGLEESLGLSIPVGDQDYKNTMAWLAFKETARKIAEEIGVES